MKKLLLLAVCGTLALSAAAQQKTVEGSKFFDNWSIGIQGGGISKTTHSAYWANTRAIYGLELTKQITPVFGLGFEGLAGNNWTESYNVIDDVMVDVLAKINASNLFCGYKGKPRLFEVEAVAGIGWHHGFLPESQGDDNNSMVSKFGLNFNFNLGQKRAWTVSLKPAIIYEVADAGNPGFCEYNINRSGIQMAAGVTYHFKNSNGLHYFKAARLYDQAEVDALNAKINGLRGEVADRDAEVAQKNRVIADLQRRLNDCENRPTQVVEKVVENKGKDTNSMEQTVTFRQGKSTVDAAQLPNVERIATFMKNHPSSTVAIKGYASPEGNAEINARLARERAEAVKTILVNKYKIAAARITAEGQGVGNMFSEPDWNRVSICTLSETK